MSIVLLNTCKIWRFVALSKTNVHWACKPAIELHIHTRKKHRYTNVWCLPKQQVSKHLLCSIHPRNPFLIYLLPSLYALKQKMRQNPTQHGVKRKSKWNLVIVADCSRLPSAVVPGWITGHKSIGTQKIVTQIISVTLPQLMTPLHNHSGSSHIACLW